MAQPLRPTLRERQRYVVYTPTGYAAVRNAYNELFGISGLAHAGMLRLDERDNKGIVRVTHDAVDRLKAALVWSDKHSIKTSGTLRAAREALNSAKNQQL